VKIVFDIGHPAHVHYFKNLYKFLKKTDNQILIIARDKEVTHNLLRENSIPFLNRGQGSTGFFGKFLYLIKTNHFVYKNLKNFKPDITLSFCSPYLAQASWLRRVPHICFTDTEHAKLGIKLTIPFSEKVITPKFFKKDFGKKHITFNGFMELSYLHKKYYKPNSEIKKILGVGNEKYVIVRFVSWEASHDFGIHGLSEANKIKLINFISKKAKVFVSSEGSIPSELKKYKLNISPELMHDALFYSSLYVGEGATLAAESALLKTPAIYVNELSMGYISELEKYGYLKTELNFEKILNSIEIILKDKNTSFNKMKINYEEEFDDTTGLMIQIIEKYNQ